MTLGDEWVSLEGRQGNLSASNKPYQHLVFEQPALPGSVPHVSLIGFNFCPEVRLKDGRESSCNFALLFLKYFS